MIVISVLLSLLVAPVLSTPLHSSREPLVGGFPGVKLAPLVAPPVAKLIPNQFIVVLKPEVTAQEVDAHVQLVQQFHETDALRDGSGLVHIYDHVLKGYAGRFTNSTLDKIRALPEVEYVERDQVVQASYEPVTTEEVQKLAPWGLARISHPNKLSLSTLGKYLYEPKGGEGVDVYVIDTGIDTSHIDFEGRASWGQTFPSTDASQDTNGHGTHCAGTIASKTYGVAKFAKLYAVKVLNEVGQGQNSDVIAGVDWATTSARQKTIAAIKQYQTTGTTAYKGSVINMSLIGPRSAALETAVNTAVSNGLHVAVAAGNDNRNACNYSPANAELAITVAASDIGDTKADFSNYGGCVDIFAPGVNVKSTHIGSNDAAKTMSGTSMASPHVAGLLAYFLSIKGNPTFNPTFNASNKKKTHHVYSWSPRAAFMSVLPRWMSAFIPGSFIAALEKATMLEIQDDFYYEDGTLDVTMFGGITPAQLKTALLRLGIVGQLNGLPDYTVNRLAFNNATA